MKLLTLLLALVFSLSASAQKASDLPQPTAYVDDYANVLSDDGRAAVEALCREVHDKTRAQIFVVTIQTLDGEEIAPFSNELFHRWKIGEAKTDRGILFLLAIADHKRRIEVGSGLEGILNDAKVGDIGREMVPDLKAADYDGATLLGVQRIAAVIAADSNVTLDSAGSTTPQTAVPAHEESKGTSSGVSLAFLLFAAAWLGILFLSIFGRNRRSSGGLSSGGSGTSFFSSGSDSSSSDSSSSDSSSDSGFSGGDGGDSGGGGADGSW